MSCKSQGCLKEVVYFCNTCIELKASCIDHARAHLESQKDHTLGLLTNQQILALKLILIKSKLKKCISSIAEDTANIISTIKRESHKTIKNLKELNLHFDEITEFKSFSFDRDRILFLNEQVGLISKNMNDSIVNQNKRLHCELENKNKEMDKGMKKVNDPENENKQFEELEEKIIELQKVNEYKTTRIKEKNKSFHDIRSLINHRGNNFRNSIHDLYSTTNNVSCSNQNIIENINNILDDEEYKSDKNSGFLDLNLDQRKVFARTHIKEELFDAWTQGLIRSKDGKYLFECNLHKDSKINEEGYLQ